MQSLPNALSVISAATTPSAVLPDQLASSLVSVLTTRRGVGLTDMAWEHAAEARAALNALITDPEHGLAALPRGHADAGRTATPAAAAGHAPPRRRGRARGGRPSPRGRGVAGARRPGWRLRSAWLRPAWLHPAGGLRSAGLRSAGLRSAGLRSA